MPSRIRPTGPMRVAHELALRGLQVSSGGVRGVWSRHDLLTTARPAAAPGEDHRRAADRAHARTGQAPGALQPGVPRAAYRGPTYGCPGRGRHLLRRGAEGRRQGLPADRDRLPFPLRLGQAVHQQAAGDRGADPQQRRPTGLRGAGSGDRRRAQRQWPRVLRPRGSASLRAVPAAGRHRPQDHPGRPAAEQRDRRNACTAPCSTSICASRAAPSGTRPWPRCRPHSMPGSCVTTASGRIRDAA